MLRYWLGRRSVERNQRSYCEDDSGLIMMVVAGFAVQQHSCVGEQERQERPGQKGANLFPFFNS